MSLPDDMPQIQILLAEYNTLRAEIISRTGNGFQLVAIGFAILALLLSQNVMQPASQVASSTGIGWRFWCVFVLGTILLAGGTWFNLRDIGRAANRVRLLEKEINDRAGEQLLQWEGRFSPGATGWFGPANSPPAKEERKTSRHRNR